MHDRSSRRRDRAGRAVAAAGLLVLTVSGCTDQPTVAVTDLTVGTCFDDVEGIADDTVLELPVVACDEPHDNEVVARWSFPDDAEYPGDDEIVTEALAGCVERFEAYVGAPYDSSELEVFPFFPTFGGWVVGDRDVVCSVYSGDLEPRTGSVADQGR